MMAAKIHIPTKPLENQRNLMYDMFQMVITIIFGQIQIEDGENEEKN